MTQVRQKVFGKDSRPTVYYIVAYGGSIKAFRPHIYSLVLFGYRVVAFEYDRTVLNSGDPQTLVDAVNEHIKLVKKDKKRREVAGIYGVSLGTWLAQNVMNELGIERGVLNSAGSRIANAIWSKPLVAEEKRTYRANGLNHADLEKYWLKYDIMRAENGFNGKKILMMNSRADEVIDIHEARQTVKSWRSFGNAVEFIEFTRLNHRQSIIRNMLRVRKVTKFFAQD